MSRGPCASFLQIVRISSLFFLATSRAVMLSTSLYLFSQNVHCAIYTCNSWFTHGFSDIILVRAYPNHINSPLNIKQENQA